MEYKYKFKLDKRSKRVNIFISILLVILSALFIVFSMDQYLSVWSVATAAAVAALYILSIPRYIRIDNESLEVHCIVELVKIELQDIKSARAIENRELKPYMPLLGSFGFFGYYGWYYDLKEWDIFKLYASELSNLIEINTIYEERYIISCSEREKLIALINKQ